jgi:hypothetical protein
MLTSEPSAASMWNLLRSLGFVEAETKLHLKFGNLELRASQIWNECLTPIVFLTGNLSSRQTIAMVAYELPPQIESPEQGLAFLAYALQDHVRHLVTVPAWLLEGQLYRHLLPWERERAAYEARSHCYVQRDWVRLAFKMLAVELIKLDDNALVTFWFDGGVLTIRCVGTVIAMPANGRPWKQRFSLKAGALRKLPSRLMHDTIAFSVWDSAITIGNRRFSGVIGADVGSDGG